MNPDTRLEFPIDTVPKNGTMYSINDDLHWVRMPLPMSLNHINLWLIGSKDQATLVDTGMFLDDVKSDIPRNLIRDYLNARFLLWVA